MYRYEMVWRPPKFPLLPLWVRTTEDGEQTILTTEQFNAELEDAYVEVAQVCLVPRSDRPMPDYEMWWP